MAPCQHPHDERDIRQFLFSRDARFTACTSGRAAERYFKDDPNTSLIKLRQFDEVLTPLADATNLGLTRMARSSGIATHPRLLWTAQWHNRARYIAATRTADRLDFGPLLAFIRMTYQCRSRRTADESGRLALARCLTNFT
jgi:hypothetical protein